MLLRHIAFGLVAAAVAHSASIAIDFGLESVKVVLIKPGRTIDVVLNRDSKRKTPAAICLRGDDRAFGQDALSLIYKHPKQTYRLLKSLLGRYANDGVCQRWNSRHPNDLTADVDRGTVIFMHETGDIAETNYAVEELVGMLFSDLKLQAEETAKEPVKEVVISVPAYFTHWQRRAIKDAAELAGLKVISMLNDGTAVVLNYALPRDFNQSEFHVIYDMGAGDTQVTVAKFGPVEIKDGSRMKTVQQAEILASTWDRTLGGWDIDDRLARYLSEKFVEQKGDALSTKNVWDNTRARLKLEKEANRVKHILSANVDTTASIESLFEDHDFRLKLARADLEGLIQDHATRATAVVQTAQEQAGVQLKEVTSIILVGGGVRVPFIRAALDAYAGEDRIATNLNGDEAVAFGAAFRAVSLSKKFKAKDVRLKDISTHAIQVAYQSEPKHTENKDEQQEDPRVIHTTLYKKNGPISMRKLMVFRRTSSFNFTVSYVPESMPEGETEDFGSADLVDTYIPDVSSGLRIADPELELVDAKVKVSMELDDFGLFSISDARIFRSLKNLTVAAEQAAAEETEGKTEEKVCRYMVNYLC